MENVAELATPDPVMNAAIKTALVMALIAVVALFMFFGGGAMTDGSPGMPGSSGMRGIGWIWISIFLSLSLSILLGWFISGKNNRRQ